ncbi:MAG: hypothetical protein WDM84_08465 [Bauldia sp.]
MSGYDRNLVMVQTENLQSRAEFEAIAARVAARAPEIEVFVVNNSMRNSVSTRAAALRPTLVFSPIELRRFKPRRGKIYAGRSHSKIEEMQQMQRHGVPVPDGVILEPQTRLDPGTWGPFTVLKPNRGLGGNGIRLARTRDVRWTDPESWPRDDPRYGRPIVAQKFVDTGAYTTCHKVTVLFGRPLWSTTSRALATRPFRVDPDGTEPLNEPIAANHGERTVTLNFDDAVLAVGVHAAQAFPDIPVAGVDVIREESTGRLFALEVNAGGLTWHTSSGLGLALQRDRGIDLVAQFGALDVAADALIEVTRREAA